MLLGYKIIIPSEMFYCKNHNIQSKKRVAEHDCSAQGTVCSSLLSMTLLGKGSCPAPQKAHYFSSNRIKLPCAFRLCTDLQEPFFPIASGFTDKTSGWVFLLSKTNSDYESMRTTLLLSRSLCFTHVRLAQLLRRN